jgi:putative ABC transport system permease protein
MQSSMERKGTANVSYPQRPDVKANVQIRWGDPAYIDVYKLKLVAGTNVAASDTMREFIINETYAALLGFKTPEAAVGEVLEFNNKKLPIVGVMQDFHDQSTHAGISPLVFSGAKGSTFHVRLSANNEGVATWKQAISKIQKHFNQVYPDEVFDYHFFDETIASFYEREQQTARLLSWTTALAILISCLGLLCLVMFTIHTRNKEVGIRKILVLS